jgi:XTP/dITP diphosphohydrolase
MEKKVKEQGKLLNQLTLEELEEIWQEAKLTEKK